MIHPATAGAFDAATERVVWTEASRRGHTLSDIARPIAWAFTVWGTGLYLWAGAVYLCIMGVKMLLSRPDAPATASR